VRIGDMQIRRMLIDDYEGVYELWMSCVGMGLNNLDDSKEGINQFLKRNPDTCFVATDENKIIGVIIVGNDGRRGYIYHTAINPEYRMQGIGTKLVDIALQALKNDNINKVALVVFDRNSTGNSFWERRGFTIREGLVYRNKTLTEMVRIDT
jgi:ribosomal protein S18 acetylase RimI-like enzyme